MLVYHLAGVMLVWLLVVVVVIPPQTSFIPVTSASSGSVEGSEVTTGH